MIARWLPSRSPRYLEILISWQTTLLGLWLANPWIDSGTVSTPYSRLEVLAPEWLWGMLTAVVGLANLIATYRRCQTRWHQWARLAMFGMLLFLTIVSVLAEWRSTLLPMRVPMLVALAWLYLADRP